MDCKTPKKFHSKYLSELFFNTLNNNKRKDFVFLIDDESPFADGKKVSVPYLNGGLFDDDFPKGKQIDFPVEYFTNLFEFFNAYNFTIDENDPYDSEIGIDPEMLGHIFENLLEENREKGAYYTPKEVVHYMSQQSLIEYLKSKLNTDNEAIDKFIIENSITPFVEQNAERIKELLTEIKMCDPAIGSGAFPMGVLKEIFEGLQKIHDFQNNGIPFDAAAAKKHIIQHSIYGVDLEKGAVDIARLRFWLALVVDEDTPQPLPNLDYKIMQGNSLLESFEGIDLSKVHTVSKTTTIYESEKDLFGNVLNPQLKFTDVKVLQENNLQELMQRFFDENDPTKKQEQRERINQTVHEHIDYNLELWQNSLERQIGEAPKLNIQGLKAATKKKIEELHKQLENLKEKRKKLHELQNTQSKPYFLWHLYFKDVLEQDGFDIVIGNPPYIKEYTNRNVFNGFRNSKYYQGKMDLWYGFACVTIDMLKQNGVQCFIAQNNWITSKGASIMRNKILSDGKILSFVDFGNYKVFESAGIQTMIYVIQNKTTETVYDVKYSLLKTDKVDSTQLNQFLNFQTPNDYSEKYIFSLNSQQYLNKTIGFNNSSVEKLLQKVEEKGAVKKYSYLFTM